jgi:hypothetical protein
MDGQELQLATNGRLGHPPCTLPLHSLLCPPPRALAPPPQRPHLARNPTSHQGDLQRWPTMHVTSPTEEAINAVAMTHTDAGELPSSCTVAAAPALH